MNHSEAIQEMAAEKYLLDELTPEARHAFEEHMFDCPQCAIDVRAGALFVDETKLQMPEIEAGSAEEGSRSLKEARKRWFSWFQPVFAMPVMAALLAIVGYQNLVTIPVLHTEADQPRVVPTAPPYGATRGDIHPTITADRSHGISLPVDIPIEGGNGNYSSYAFVLVNPQGKPVWSGSIASSAQQIGPDLELSVVVPGSMLETGTYALTVYGVGSNGIRSELDRQVFEVTLTK